MNRIFIYLIFFFTITCKSEVKHQKTQFYKLLNPITLQAASEGFDTLQQLPYVKVDSLSKDSLRILFVQTREYRYEFLLARYGKGWLRHFTSQDGGWNYHHFDIYADRQIVSYNYRNNPYKDKDFQLLSIEITKMDYSETKYIFPFRSQKILNLPEIPLKVDTSLYDIRHTWYRSLRKDTLIVQWDTYFRDSSSLHEICYIPAYNLPIEYVIHDGMIYNKKQDCQSTK
jgi:hypothetical protein